MQNVLQIDRPADYAHEPFVEQVSFFIFICFLILSRRLPSLAPNTMTRSMQLGLNMYVKYLTMEAARHRDSDARHMCDQFDLEVMAPWKRRCSHAKSDATNDKEVRDTEAVRNAPALDTIKTAVKNSMIRLAVIERDTKGERLSQQVNFVINRELAGVCFHNTYGGRPGEWCRFKMGDVLNDCGEGHIVAKWHKTHRKYGALAKWISPGLKEAICCVARMRGKTNDVFLFKPSCPDAKVSIHNLLKSWHTLALLSRWRS